MDRIRLLIDTDIGGDIDDALTLAMALNSPEINLLGVTTVYSTGQWRADLVKGMLKTWGREGVPVRRGAERPLLGRYPHDQGAEPMMNEAVPFLIKTCRENPGLTLLGIGPMTNVALALAQAPDIIPTTRFVFMGGMLKCALPEWNVLCDPEAAKMVFDLVPLSLIGLDVTEQCRLSREEAERLTEGDDPRLRFLKGEFDRFFTQFTFPPTLHDPLALASLLWDGLITWEDLDIRVETRGELTRGATVHMRHEKSGRVQWGREVRAEEALLKMTRRIRGEG